MSILNYENKRLLDVVDENDNIVDFISRDQIHYLGLLHREVHIWMVDDNNNIIFQKRGLNRAKAGLLDATVAGHVNKGENYIDAAIRETKEETGLKISPSDLVLIEKIKGLEVWKNPWGQKNSFLRTIYIYKPMIDYKKIRREPGIPGVGFQKLSIEFLYNLTDKEREPFVPFILNQELPLILEYLNKNAAANY